MTIGFIMSNDRQNNLEKNIQCPCDKGLLINHASSSAMKLKSLISELCKDSISMNSIQSLILKTQFISDNPLTKDNETLTHQDCLIKNIKSNISNHQISDDGIYNIIGQSYGHHLIRQNKNNSSIYIILFIIISIGIISSSIFIVINKKRKL